MKTFNKKGDNGETSLLFGQRIPKDSPRCEAFGTIDELVSCLGIARNTVAKDRTKEVIRKLQEELFIVNAELAAAPEDHEKYTARFASVNDHMVDEIEELIDELEAKTELPTSFIVPGSTPGSGWIDFSRSIARRAERRVVTLKNSSELDNAALLRYLNRTADLLFILARYEEN